MSTVTASICIAAPVAVVWETVMDPRRLGEWVTIHRRLTRADDGPPREGFEIDQQIHLRGINLEVHWRLIECVAEQRAVWEGRGPARSRARTTYVLAATGEDATRFDYSNEFHPPLGSLGALASGAFVGGMPEREAQRTLAQLQRLLTR